MNISILEPVSFPKNGWLSTRLVGPEKGRVLIEVRGHSGSSSWLCGLLTAPEDCIKVVPKEWGRDEIMLIPGRYTVEEGVDKRGQRIVRLFKTTEANLIAFQTNGLLVAEVSSPSAITLLQAEGHSRTWRNGDRWSLIAAPPGAIVAIEPYGKMDPVYYKVADQGIVVLLGETDAVLSPADW